MQGNSNLRVGHKGLLFLENVETSQHNLQAIYKLYHIVPAPGIHADLLVYMLRVLNAFIKPGCHQSFRFLGSDMRLVLCSDVLIL